MTEADDGDDTVIDAPEAEGKAEAAANRGTPARKTTPRTQTPRTPARKPAAPAARKTAATATRKPAPRKPPATGRKKAPVVVPEPPKAPEGPVVLAIRGLGKRYGSTVAVENLDLEVRAGTFYGIVGPNGAGKTTTLSIATGLLRPDSGTVEILGSDVWSSKDSRQAKRSLGVLPDRLRLFDRLTGAQFLYYAGTLRGLDGATARKRSADLAEAFGLQDALGRLVSDYSVGMTKKVALAAAIIHSPRVLVLDEPFESVDPVSAATVTEILQRYVRGGGTVLLSSHSMDLVERICDSVAVIVDGHVLAQGTVHDVRAGRSLQERFVELAGGQAATEGMEWLHSFSD
ncbi:ABC-2 type transport system ATP-binding protein [Frondihabitans sp. PhB188]|uniref:ABC transporter ATP-binding protein n=1 Tax=Frondihabitans sp. PhB188 TaxID=2485200 RepID=UPI000FB19807|nr:ABC transporter ATP-binding protein [Frondihabitans sp. PhB188]ROQ38400.1 ABC-2 type transport system ATP-binding protein [Frondihabitans sp. PhB188]